MSYADIVIDSLRALEKSSPELFIATELETTTSEYSSVTLKSVKTVVATPIKVIIDTLDVSEQDGSLITALTVKVIASYFEVTPKVTDTISVLGSKYGISKVSPICVGSTVVAYIMYLNV